MVAAEAEHAVPLLEQSAHTVMNGIVGIDPGQAFQRHITRVMPKSRLAEIASSFGKHVGRVTHDGMPDCVGPQSRAAKEGGIVVLRKPQQGKGACRRVCRHIDLSGFGKLRVKTPSAACHPAVAASFRRHSGLSRRHSEQHRRSASLQTGSGPTSAAAGHAAAPGFRPWPATAWCIREARPLPE